MRRYDEEVDVRSDGCLQEKPEWFVWRGRLYVVRSVVDHWWERRAWWRSVLDTDEASLDALDLQEEVWRVEASPGRHVDSGVYDLAHGRSWRLVRTVD